MHGRHPPRLRDPGSFHGLDGRKFELRSLDGKHLAVFEVIDGRAIGHTTPTLKRFNVVVRFYGIAVSSGLPRPKMWFPFAKS